MNWAMFVLLMTGSSALPPDTDGVFAVTQQQVAELEAAELEAAEIQAAEAALPETASPDRALPQAVVPEATDTKGVEAAVNYKHIRDEFTLVSAATRLVTILFTILIGPMVVAAGVLTTILIVNAGQENSLRFR